MEEGENTEKNCYTLYSMIDKKTRTIDLEDNKVCTFTNNFRLEIDDVDSQLELLTMLYHAADAPQSNLSADVIGEIDKKRYFLDTVLCYECGEMGHTESRCPRNSFPFCILCAQKGHYKNACPMRICLKCFNCGHRVKECQERGDGRRFSTCTRCFNSEHAVVDCPVWRKYVFKGKIKGIVKKACPLCLSEFHFVDDCNSNRSKFSIFNSNYHKIRNNSRHENNNKK